MADETILALAADIVTAHVSHNSVSVNDLPTLIQSVFGALAALGQDAPTAEESHTPAVSVRASIKPDALTCLDCGAKMKMLKRHLATDHGLSPADYRARWKLPADYPMVTAEYAARRKALALQIGLGRKPKAAAIAAPIEPAPVPVASKTAAPKRKSATVKVPDVASVEAPVVKPKAAPRKKLKVAFNAVDVGMEG